MSQQVMSLVEKASLKSEVPQFEVGDTVDVHCRILEGDKERIQIFNGLVIARAGSTGYSTGPHCHFEGRQNGSPVNPLAYLP